MIDDIKDSITTRQFLREFEKFVSDNGGGAETARMLGLMPQNITNIKSGDKLPGPVVLAAMGYEPMRSINYRYRKIS